MVYPIVKYGDPVLEAQGGIVMEFNTPELDQLIADMFESMYAAKGVGLAAPQIGISRRIERDEERSRLKHLMQKLRKPGSGYIVRTVSEGVSDEELRSDVEFLQASWEEILEKKRRLSLVSNC